MARRKAEIDLLGVASKEELVKFEVGKEVDKPLAETVAQINNKSGQSNLVTEEELLRIRKKGEQEILDIQNELKEFKMNEERMISFLPIEEEEEEEIYVPTKRERIFAKLKAPFIFMVDKYDGMNTKQKFNFLKSIVIILLVLFAMSLAVFATKKYKIVYRDFVKIELIETGGGKYAMPNFHMNIDGEDFTLTKLVVDGENTVFTFDGPGNVMENKNAYLVDMDGNEYYIDQHYMRNMRASNQGKVIAFEPLLDGTQKFDLVITNIETGHEDIYRFKFKKFLEKPPYIEMYNTENISQDGLNINSFTASATGSVLDYSLISNDPEYTYKIINAENLSSGLYQHYDIIPSKQNKIESYDFPERKATLYQESFMVPSDLNGIVEFRANNIFKSYPVNKTYTASQLQQGMEINVGQYTLYIEGIQKRGDMAVLVYHVIDNEFEPVVEETEKPATSSTINAPTTSASIPDYETENFTVVEEKLNETERVYALLDAEIVRVNGYGDVIDTIPPSKINASDEGADMVFVDDRLKGVVGNYRIRINSVNIRDTAYRAKIDLSENGKNTASDEEFKTALNNIEEGFDSRLGYRAAEKTRSQIVYFSEDVMNDKELITRYLPLNLDKKANYTTEIISATKKDNYVIAVIEETFVADTGEKIVNKSTIHKVMYDINKEEIIYDDIISDKDLSEVN